MAHANEDEKKAKKLELEARIIDEKIIEAGEFMKDDNLKKNIRV